MRPAYAGSDPANRTMEELYATTRVLTVPRAARGLVRPSAIFARCPAVRSVFSALATRSLHQLELDLSVRTTAELPPASISPIL
jgi:hypothetical protein